MGSRLMVPCSSQAWAKNFSPSHIEANSRSLRKG